MSRAVGLFVAWCCLLFAGRAAAWEGQVQLGLFNRLTVQENSVERLLRYDPQAKRFDTAGYLAPKNDAVYYSLLASVTGFVAPTSWFGVVVSADTGELALTGQLPAAAEVQHTYQWLENLGFPKVIETNSTEDERMVLANGLPIADEAKETYFIRQVFVELAAPKTGWIALQGGRIAAEVGRSLVYDDFALGARLSADLTRLNGWPIAVELAGLVPTRTWNSGMNSPLVSLRIDYLFAPEFDDDELVQQIGLVAAYYHDGDDNFSRLFAPYVDERLADWYPANSGDLRNYAVATLMSLAGTSSANLGWVGVDATQRLGDLILSGVLLFEFGQVEVAMPLDELPTALSNRLPGQLSDTLSLDTFGVALELVGLYTLNDHLSLGAFFLFLSGEDNPWLTGQSGQSGRFDSFLGVVPYVTHSNIFFSGGMNESFSGRQATTAGINGRGVVAFGPNIAWSITDEASAEVGTAFLWAPEPSMTDGHFYGFEMDVEGAYTLFDWLEVAVEYDVLVPGGFFRDDTVVHQFLFGINATYGHGWSSDEEPAADDDGPRNQPSTDDHKIDQKMLSEPASGADDSAAPADEPEGRPDEPGMEPVPAEGPTRGQVSEPGGGELAGPGNLRWQTTS